MTSLYSTLGVKKDCPSSEIKGAYRRRMREAHPDKGGSASEAAEVNKAYQVLSDPARRLEYDRTGTYQDAPPPSGDSRLANDAVHLFAQAIANDPDGDVVGAMLAKVKAIQRDGQSQLAQLRMKLRSLEKAKKKLRHKGKARADVLASFLDTEEGNVGAAIKRVEAEIEYGDTLAAYIKEWEYEVDPGPRYASTASTAYSHPLYTTL